MLKDVDGLDLAEEAASEALALFFSSPEFDRPQNEDDFGRWVYWRCVNYLSNRSKELIRDHSGERPESDIPIDFTSQWLIRKERPDQETHLMVWDALHAIDQLPPTMKRMAYKMAAGANVLEASEEMEMPISETIKMQKALRELTQWMSDAESDERLAAADVGAFGDHAFKRAKERHGLELTKANMVEITRKIRGGLARLVAEDGPTVKIYRVPFKGLSLPVAYNPIANIVLSVLPKLLHQEIANKVVHPLSSDSTLIPKVVLDAAE